MYVPLDLSLKFEGKIVQMTGQEELERKDPPPLRYQKKKINEQGHSFNSISGGTVHTLSPVSSELLSNIRYC